jgi:hypothetical protein
MNNGLSTMDDKLNSNLNSLPFPLSEDNNGDNRHH